MIQTFFSSQVGAPVLSGTAGSLISVLDACLVTGFNTKTVDSATFASGTVTLSISSGHNFVVGQYITVAGANETAYNGTYQVTAITSTTVQYAITGTPTSPATGTITAKIAPLGWSKPFSDASNHAAYQPAAGNQLYLRVDDNGPVTGSYGVSYRTAVAYLLETMSDINTWTPASGYAQCYIRKAQNLTATARPWIIIGDASRFYFFTNWSETYPDTYSPYFFGDILSYKTGDIWQTLLAGHYGLYFDSSYSPNIDNLFCALYSLANTVAGKGMYLARSSSQIGAFMSALLVNGTFSASGAYAPFGTGSLAYPNSSDNGLFFQPVSVQEQTNLPNIRGAMPGLWTPFQLPVTTAGYGTFSISISGAVRSMLVVRCAQPVDASTLNPSPYSNMALDITGPWQ